MAEALQNLLETASPPAFIYLHHPNHSSTSLSSLPAFDSSNKIVAKLDTIEYHSSRLIWSGILHKVTGDNKAGEVASFDAFSVALRKWSDARSSAINGVVTRKGKGKENGDGDVKHQDENVVILVTHAERLKSIFGHAWAAITRLSELTGVKSCVVLASTKPWDDVRMYRADSPEPLHIYLPSPSRKEIYQTLSSASTHPLYGRFLDLLIAAVLPLVTLPIEELDYLSEALWPLYTRSLPPHAEMTLLGLPYPDPADPPPPIAPNINVKLLTDLKHQLSLPLSSAIEILLPRFIGRDAFTQSLLPATSASGGRASLTVLKLPGLEQPLVARFVLVAAYCGSYNPATSDIKLFGRGFGPGGKRRRGGGFKRAGYGKVRAGKVPQRLLGPKALPLDRLLSLFFSLYAENAPRPADLEISFSDDESSDEDDGPKQTWPPTLATNQLKEERKRKRERERQDQWDQEVEELMMSVKFWGMLSELEAQGLLKRSSPVDRLDNVMIRCEIDYETAKTLAKDLKLSLDEYLYEATH